MVLGQLIIGAIVGLASSVYAYLALDVSLLAALGIYSGIGVLAVLSAVAWAAFLAQPATHDVAPDREPLAAEPVRRAA